MAAKEYPEEFLTRLAAIKSKRPKAVIVHILEHEFVTTEELKTIYGYNHPPRAARDVRELGIPLETYEVKDSTGRSIGAYRFGDPSQIRNDRVQGRVAFPKKFKQELIKLQGEKCAICSTPYEERYLQVDHCIPYEVAGEGDAGEIRNPNDYMLLDGSCNRAKSWSCEHCKNLLEDKKPEVCKTCYWASPNDYKHIAMRDIRRLDLEWSGEDVEWYDALHRDAEANGINMPDYIKTILKNVHGEAAPPE